MKVVIRAGGVGSRLWPLSRQGHPKQFQAVIGQDTMLSATYKRLKGLARPEDIFISINYDCLDKLKSLLPDCRADNLITETESKNTGPAICLETAWLKNFCAPDEIIASLPADDYIADVAAFHKLLRLSADWLTAHPDYILTPAVRPTIVDTGYSYLKTGRNLSGAGEEAIYEVAGVMEKPNADYCQQLIDSGVYYCHTGMYIWRLDQVDSLFAKWQPTLYDICQKTAAALLAGNMKLAAELYSGAEKMSVEAALTNKAPRVAMSVSNEIGWSDLGKWPIIKRMLSAEGDNLIKGQVVSRQTKNCLIYNHSLKKIVVLNDVEDLVVVETPDALLISSLKQAADIKECLDKVQAEGSEFL